MSNFRFGLEAEYFLAQTKTHKPLWHKDVTFTQIDNLFSQIPIDDIPSLNGLTPEEPHKKLMPFIVEGYGIQNAENATVDALPKGVEIRTPVCNSIEQTIDVFETLFGRVKSSLSNIDVMPIALSHHPTESKFYGPQNKRRYDFWLWAMEVMTTYGPDINVSFPDDISAKIFENIDDLNAKVDYYAAAIALPSLNSPFYKGSPWIHKGFQGKSYRTFKRSVVAPAIELHPEENNRIEFKVCEMSKNSSDFYAYFLLVLTLFLNDELMGRASKQERIYELGAISYLGFDEKDTVYKLRQLLNSAEKTLKPYDFNLNYLSVIEDRIRRKKTPADDLIKFYYANNQSLEKVIERQSVLQTIKPSIAQ